VTVIRLHPCAATVICGPCVPCKEYYDLSRDDPDFRVVYAKDALAVSMVSGAVTYHTGGSPTTVGMTVVASTHKLCVGSTAIAGPLVYTTGVPHGATITDVAYTYNNGVTNIVVSGASSDTCTNYLTQIKRNIGTIGCATAVSVIVLASSCPTDPTAGAAANLMTAGASCASPAVCTGAWPGGSGICRIVPVSFGSCTMAVDTSLQTWTNSGTHTRYRSGLPVGGSLIWNWDARVFNIPFSTTVTTPAGTCSVAGYVKKLASPSAIEIGITSVTNIAGIPSDPGTGTSTSCTSAPACPPVDSGTVTVDFDTALECTPIKLRTRINVSYSDSNIAGGTGECCRCTTGTRVKGRQKSVALSSVVASLV